MVNASFTIHKDVAVTINSGLVPLEKDLTLEYKKHPECAISRKTTLLHNSLGKNYSGSINFIYCKGVRNPICKSLISEENNKIKKKNVKRAIFISVTRNFGNSGEKSYPK